MEIIEITRDAVNKALKDPFCKKLSNVAGRCGYELKECFYSMDYDEYRVSLKEIDEYAPPINFDEDGNISMGTISYGDLSGKEIDAYIDALQNARILIEYMDSIDWSDCPDIDYYL